MKAASTVNGSAPCDLHHDSHGHLKWDAFFVGGVLCGLGFFFISSLDGGK